MNVKELIDFASGCVEYCEDLSQVVDVLRDMGFGGTPPTVGSEADVMAEFERATGADPHDLMGRYWAVVGGRVFIADE